MSPTARQNIAYALVGGYLLFAAMALVRIFFLPGEIPHLEAALGLIGGIGAFVGVIAERLFTQASHELRRDTEARVAIETVRAQAVDR